MSLEISNCIVSTLRHAVHILVKEAQSKPEVVFKDGPATNNLCSAIEAVLLNGQEVMGYRKMFKKIGFSSTRQPFECCFWEYLQYYLPKDLIEIIRNSRIMEKRTDIGCCRVWVRMALNEATLCNFIDAMRADDERTRQFYTPPSLMRDPDRMEAALGLLRMVTSECHFDLDCQRWELNSWTLSTALALANVRYVVPAVTSLRRHGFSDATERPPSLPALRPSSLSSPEDMESPSSTVRSLRAESARSPEVDEEKDDSPASATPSTPTAGELSNEKILSRDTPDNAQSSSAVSFFRNSRLRFIGKASREEWPEAIGSQESNTIVVRSPSSSLARNSNVSSVGNEVLPSPSEESVTAAAATTTAAVPTVGSVDERPPPMSVEDRVALSRAFSMPEKRLPGASSSLEGETSLGAQTQIPPAIAEANRDSTFLTRSVSFDEEPLEPKLITRLKKEGRSVSPHDLLSQMQPLRTMSPSAVVAEAVRRGLLVSSSSLEEGRFEEHSGTLIRAVEEHRKRECERQVEDWREAEAERENEKIPPLGTPPTTASDTSSWDQNIVPSSSSPSELAPQSMSTPEIIDDDRDQEFDEFAIFPRRRTRNESEDFEALAADSDPQNVQIPRPLSVPFNLDRSTEGNANPVSTSWNQDQRFYRMKQPRAVVTPSRPHRDAFTAPASDGIIDRIVANLPGGRRGSASNFISRIGAAVSTPFAARPSQDSANSDDEWELVGDEFMAKKNARTKRLMDLHPGAKEVPDPQYDFADTNCTRCRAHIVGPERKLDHFDGRWYCGCCHEGATAIIPRDVLCNWDFSEYPVSSETKVALTKLFLQPNIDVMKRAPKLYSLCPDLGEVTRARRQLSFLWQYVGDCPSGFGRTLTRMLIPRERLIGSVMEVHLYSLEDLTLVHRGGALLKVIHHVLRDGLAHVNGCNICQTARQHFCDGCGVRVPLYEIDIYMKCVTATCDVVIHSNCFRHHPDDFICRECIQKKALNVPLHETYDAEFRG